MIYQNVKSLTLDVACNLTISRSSSREVSVTVNGTDSKLVKVLQDSGDLSVSFEGSGNSITMISGNGNIVIGDVVGGRSMNFFGGSHSGSVQVTTVSGGQSVSIVNGVVYVNGKQVKEDSSAPDIVPVSIKISCPDDLILSATLKGCSNLASIPVFDSVRLNCQGSCEADLRAKKAKVKVFGSATVSVELQEGDFTANISGSGNVRASGSFGDCDVDVSGSGSVVTSGPVCGNYDASVSGVGSITHTGRIKGSQNKSVSGMGRIHL